MMSQIPEKPAAGKSWFDNPKVVTVSSIAQAVAAVGALLVAIMLYCSVETIQSRMSLEDARYDLSMEIGKYEILLHRIGEAVDDSLAESLLLSVQQGAGDPTGAMRRHHADRIE